MSFTAGQIVEGKVTGITNFGAFVELAPGTTGLVHISEVADVYVKDINDYLKMNDSVRVKILSIKDGKIGLSIRQAQPGGGGRHTQQSFEDKLSKFLKDSDERQAALRKNWEGKRRGKGGFSQFRG
ncbi:MAG: S1 RNA-binding domain-containing protein [Firmicutes bacterium]|jgi:S1 RNA binding domain protein|nr:S1 RNA-binding domain-containing protein [Bacillota bacterium]